MSGPVIFVAGRLRKNERTREALAEQLRFTFSYAEKTEKGTWTGYTEYTHDEFKAKYGDILNFAGIDLRKVKDVKKEVDGVMYG